jgi:hypothetical protein
MEADNQISIWLSIPATIAYSFDPCLKSTFVSILLSHEWNSGPNKRPEYLAEMQRDASHTKDTKAVHILSESLPKRLPWLTLSTHRPSYGFLTIKLSPHAVVVRIKVLPFTYQKHPGHVFFTSDIFFFKCCPFLSSADTENEIKTRTRRALQTFYPQVSCDLDYPGW